MVLKMENNVVVKEDFLDESIELLRDWQYFFNTRTLVQPRSGKDKKYFQELKTYQDNLLMEFDT